jgi:cytochrome P450
LGTFLLAMVLYPEVQAKAQREIDSLCTGRLPDFSDYSYLPYVDAILKETLRWHPVAPLGEIHAQLRTALAYARN